MKKMLGVLSCLVAVGPASASIVTIEKSKFENNMGKENKNFISYDYHSEFFSSRNPVFNVGSEDNKDFLYFRPDQPIKLTNFSLSHGNGRDMREHEYHEHSAHNTHSRGHGYTDHDYGYFDGGHTSWSGHDFEYAQCSAVPLPAAVWLFTLGLAGLTGLGVKPKR